MGLAFDLAHTIDFLLERDDALATLFDALDNARTGRGTALLIAGEAGVGKTSLVRAFCQSLDPRTKLLARRL